MASFTNLTLFYSDWLQLDFSNSQTGAVAYLFNLLVVITLAVISAPLLSQAPAQERPTDWLTSDQIFEPQMTAVTTASKHDPRAVVVREKCEKQQQNEPKLE